MPVVSETRLTIDECPKATFCSGPGLVRGCDCGAGIQTKAMYALILAAAALMAWVRWARRRLERISDTDLAGIIEHYLYGGGDAHDWGNFVERPFRCTRL